MAVSRFHYKTATLIVISLTSLAAYCSTDSLDPCPIPCKSEPHTNVVWHGEDISGLITGDLAAGYSKYEHQSGSFGLTTFNPLFLFSYKDLLFMQAGLAFEIDDLGNSSVGVGPANLNLFINDYMVLGVGEFDSSLGYFVENLSANWINKLPTVPAGFDDLQAAPQTEMGLRMRGGFCLLNALKMNYILYVANGPIAYADDNGVVQYIAADAVSTNDRGAYTFGGRIGFFPIHKFEIGLSAAIGNSSVLDIASNELDSNRQDYNVLGADASFKWHNFDFRAEIIQQEISIDENQSDFIPLTTGGHWRTWYSQLAYRFKGKGWEPVIRYAKFQSPISIQSQEQWDFGIDYWFAPSLVAKLAYEINHGQEGSPTDSNVILAQIAFGF